MVNLPSNNIDLTETECKKAFAVGEVIWIQGNETDLSIIFFTKTSDKGFVVSKGGAVKRYKNVFERDLKITWLKGI